VFFQEQGQKDFIKLLVQPNETRQDDEASSPVKRIIKKEKDILIAKSSSL